MKHQMHKKFENNFVQIELSELNVLLFTSALNVCVGEFLVEDFDFTPEDMKILKENQERMSNISLFKEVDERTKEEIEEDKATFRKAVLKFSAIAAAIANPEGV